jgi:hypothetical protein
MVVTHQQVLDGLIFFNIGKPSCPVKKMVIRVVIVYSTHLSYQHLA